MKILPYAQIIHVFRGEFKKVVVFGGAHHKVAYPPPPSTVVVSCGIFA